MLFQQHGLTMTWLPKRFCSCLVVLRPYRRACRSSSTSWLWTLKCKRSSCKRLGRYKSIQNMPYMDMVISGKTTVIYNNSHTRVIADFLAYTWKGCSSLILNSKFWNYFVTAKLIQVVSRWKAQWAFVGNSLCLDLLQKILFAELLRRWPPATALDRVCVKDYNIGKPDNSSAAEDFVASWLFKYFCICCI